jgi:hypothetical protein
MANSLVKYGDSRSKKYLCTEKNVSSTWNSLRDGFLVFVSTYVEDDVAADEVVGTVRSSQQLLVVIKYIAAYCRRPVCGRSFVGLPLGE